MVIVMKPGAPEAAVKEVSRHLEGLGYILHTSRGVGRTLIGAVGLPEIDKAAVADSLRGHDWVEDVVLISKPYKFVSREYQARDTVVDVDGLPIGGPGVVVMAGPCTVESEEQVEAVAALVARAGATVLRGGAYKPSTSPYSFHGMGEPALRILRGAADRHGLKVVTEVMDVRRVEEVARFADILQIGTRNMQNYDLLQEVGQSGKPVLLKRGMSAKYEEWLLAAEYIATKGNPRILLCERGIRTFETATRNTLDLNAVPTVKGLSHLPMVVDPSHGTGRRELVAPMALAAVAAGADALIVEVHPDPDHAVKDGQQSQTPAQFSEMMVKVARVCEAIGRSLLRPASA
ncbi:MAG: 3-deoxy-7-phosphoheptulonate synthase [Fimbriimonadales bacterium]|nr:3-deoxy-7-phosphoheptulonate synthase [Fimbriimonadales bacterium]